MNELHRQAYLDAIGVDSYFPRAKLTGALPSPVCVIQLAAKAVVEDSPTAEQQASAAQSSAVRDVMTSMGFAAEKPGDKVGKSAALKDVVPTPQLEKQPRPVSNTVPQFSLLITAGQKFTLIAVSHSDSQNQEYQHMLVNILLALGDQPLSPCLPFNWPMINSAAVDQTAPVAQQALKAFLKDPLTNRTAIIFGAVAEHLLLPPLELGAVHQLDQLNCAAVVTHCSVQAYLNPELKRDIWQHLAPLRKLA